MWRRSVVRTRARPLLRALCLAGALAFVGCAPHPEPIAYGTDACAYCRMLITDRRFGAELVTTKGRAVKFDSIECLAGHVLNVAVPAGIHSLWVTPSGGPGTLVPVDSVYFVRSPELRAPMGGNIQAFDASRTNREAAIASHDGEVLDWPGVLATVARGTSAP